MRHVLNVSDEERQQRREQVLSTTLKDFRCRRMMCMIHLRIVELPCSIVMMLRLVCWPLESSLCHRLRNALRLCREFADVLDAVRGPKAKVVAVTSPERAAAINETEQPGFFDKITKVF